MASADFGTYVGKGVLDFVNLPFAEITETYKEVVEATGGLYRDVKIFGRLICTSVACEQGIGGKRIAELLDEDGYGELWVAAFVENQIIVKHEDLNYTFKPLSATERFGIEIW